MALQADTASAVSLPLWIWVSAGAIPIKHHIDLAGQHIPQAPRAAAMRNMRGEKACALLELLRPDAGRRPVPRGGIVDLAWVGVLA